MKNKTFLNGINFINAIMTKMTEGQALSLPGYNKVLMEIVDPGLDLLARRATIVSVKGSEIDVFLDRLSDEKFEIAPFAAQAAVAQARQYNRLVETRNQMPKGYAQRVNLQMVGPGNLLTGRLRRRVIRHEGGTSGWQDEETVVAERLLEIYEDYEGVDLGWLNFLKYRVMLMARDVLEAKYGDNCADATDNKEILLYGTIMDNIVAIREEHPEYMFDPRCNGDCASCDYYIVDDENGERRVW